MYSKEILALEDVKRVVSAAETEALRNNWNVVIAVVDDGGHLMYLQREKVQLGSVDVAISKARTALMFRRPTSFWENTVAEGRQGYLSLTGMLPIEGGLPLRYGDEIVGAIGVPDRTGWRRRPVNASTPGSVNTLFGYIGSQKYRHRSRLCSSSP